MRRLDRETVDRIAAGEVVTRPARVVVELVENALDAGADRIEIEVVGDGTDRIRVVDDGEGMSAEEAALAVERHTTSKLPDGNLSTVDTLGFRGEALASIADVANVTLTTNDGGARGTQVQVTEDGEATVDSAGRGRGTTVEVTDLFHNRPARKESLAAPATEFERISDRVATYALLRPGVAIALDHDGRRVFATPGSGAFVDAALSVYGREVARESTTLDAEASVEVGDRTAPVSVRGLLAYPSVTRAGTEHTRIAVNGRPVSVPVLRRAVERGYGSLLPGDRHPVTTLLVSLPPWVVDQNVHPTKETVALRAADTVADAVETAVSDALATADLRRSADVAMDLEAALDPVESEPSLLGDATFVGRFRDLYLLCEADGELLVIDQHAAHERINYERLRAAMESEGVPSATLDPPATLSLSPGEVAAVEAHADALARLGFDCEPFGGGTVRVRAVPAPLGRVADPDTLESTLAALRDGETAERRDELLADLACHPSLKAGDELDDDEATALIERLGACEQPFACPHGRPTVLAIDEAHLARGFERHPNRR
ncbi:DNA mismatch repair endonuclease MutL [Haloplanus aerogenes]|uniref:DNA mismatch repair protein MutL n=1 Tax=Haloplanus aerogenes TaxID=660522 RepID=A0A3M0DS10_9EURY|nr:DNA mismatch repair endonuclease MutL [Haloplanus aerogenes]AZH24166.1 DNA mismatch repair endonuclease MutL [Haloplanus aerogenes]RMB24214.1 DNA mismatch repair protein MutL [Haloplanus aerogenes]